MHLSVVIPAYNEEKRLPKTLEAVDSYLRKQNYDYEILVVNDGSKDGTAATVNYMEGVIKNLKLIDNKQNKGKGGVVKQGMLEANAEYRLFTDADNSTSVDQIETMWPEFEKGADIVIGSRDIKGAVLDPPQPFLRNMILGEGFKLIRKFIVGLWNIQDTQCGFKCFKAAAAQNIFPKCRIDRWAFDPEILVVAKKLKYKIKEVPVYWKNDPESKVNLNSIPKFVIDLMRIKLNSIKGLYA
jgi:glycosyltransferase involved in cell wall biosynthesis